MSSKIFNENFVAIYKIKESVTLYTPAYVGMCILNLSKTLIHDFHYNYVKRSITTMQGHFTPTQTV